MKASGRNRIDASTAVLMPIAVGRSWCLSMLLGLLANPVRAEESQFPLLKIERNRNADIVQYDIVLDDGRFSDCDEKLGP